MRRPAVEYQISQFFANNTLQFDGELCHKFCLFLTHCLSFFRRRRRTMCWLSGKHFSTQKHGRERCFIENNKEQPQAGNYSHFRAFFIIKIIKKKFFAEINSRIRRSPIIVKSSLSLICLHVYFHYEWIQLLLIHRVLILIYFVMGHEAFDYALLRRQSNFSFFFCFMRKEQHESWKFLRWIYEA